MKRHFELTEEFKINFLGVKLFRIKATIKSKYAEVGDLGGWIEKEENLSDNAWVYGNAEVYGNALVHGNARVSGNAWVYGDAEVYGNAWVYGYAEVSGYALVYGNARVSDNARVYGDAEVYGNAWVSDNAWVYGNAWVSGNARVSDNADTKSNNDYCCFQNFGSSNRTTTFFKEKNSKVKVSCGCFSGSIEEFEKRVKETHGEGKNAKEYLSIIEVVKIKFGL